MRTSRTVCAWGDGDAGTKYERESNRSEFSPVTLQLSGLFSVVHICASSYKGRVSKQRAFFHENTRVAELRRADEVYCGRAGMCGI